MRFDRNNDKMRSMSIHLDYLKNADGSVLICLGDTKVICSSIIEEKVPFFLKGKGMGWITAEYSMLPASTKTRKIRDISRGKLDGRSQEIQRLIGRSIRSSIDLKELGERTIWIDCDVIQADGGTRTTSINGGYIATILALRPLIDSGQLSEKVILRKIAALSLGKVNGDLLVDLPYNEDSIAEVDLNLVMDDLGNIVEIQGTGEQGVMSRQELDDLIGMGEKEMEKVFKKYDEVLK